MKKEIKFKYLLKTEKNLIFIWVFTELNKYYNNLINRLINKFYNLLLIFYKKIQSIIYQKYCLVLFFFMMLLSNLIFDCEDWLSLLSNISLYL